VLKGNVRSVTLVLVVVVALMVAGWIVTLVLFKSGETTNPPRTLTVTTIGQG
jgi:hypothetical protein